MFKKVFAVILTVPLATLLGVALGHLIAPLLYSFFVGV